MDGLDVFYKPNNILEQKVSKDEQDTILVLKDFTIKLPWITNKSEFFFLIAHQSSEEQVINSGNGSFKSKSKARV